MSDIDDRGPLRPGVRPDGDGDGVHAEVDADLEWAEYTAWLDREAAAGREPEPWPVDDLEPWDVEPWDVAPSDPDLARPSPAGPSPAGHVPGSSARSLFAEDGAGDVMPPSPFLAVLTEQAVAGVAALSDNELIGVLRARSRGSTTSRPWPPPSSGAAARPRSTTPWPVVSRPGVQLGGSPARNSPSS